MWKYALYAVAAIMNITAYKMMARDKRSAKRRRRRVSEKALFLTAICFGAIGGTIGMYLKRHKTRHWYFRVFFPLLTLVQTAVLVWTIME